LSKDKSNYVAERALYIYSPLCRLIGLTNFVKILEDGAFKILDPSEFYKVQKYIKDNYPNVNNTLNDIKLFISDILLDQGIQCTIQSRIKSIYSTYKKTLKYVKTKGKGNLENILDLAAIRIIVPDIEECYRVEDILNSFWESIEGTRDDYISKPKANGYQSLQVSYRIEDNFILEIQIRTHQMHEVNEYGLASYAAYKLKDVISKDVNKNSELLKEINYSINKTGLNMNQFTDSVYIYTPRGDIIKLPKGSTIVDFAYHIHDELGNSAIGAKVDGQFKSMDHVLENGDMVEVLTHGQKKKPSIKWLDFAKTSRARKEIRKINSDVK
jgi:guanosine-3',5'-bis(diphosphate) 3'-pyrophosphohydrolase